MFSYKCKYFIYIINILIMSHSILQVLQEECEMLRLQVNNMNNVNEHNKRGNSLFAEVDDKRQALTSELEMKKEKYETLKKLLSKANHDNNQLKVNLLSKKVTF